MDPSGFRKFEAISGIPSFSRVIASSQIKIEDIFKETNHQLDGKIKRCLKSHWIEGDACQLGPRPEVRGIDCCSVHPQDHKTVATVYLLTQLSHLNRASKDTNLVIFTHFVEISCNYVEMIANYVTLTNASTSFL